MNNMYSLDARIIHFFRRISVSFARFALFVVFFWFGILKVLGLSPAGELVNSLYSQTIPFIPFDAFYLGFAIFECLIGLMFLFKGLERVVIPFLMVHLFSTFLPLILLTGATWSGPFVPTLEGQYIIKNLLIISAAIAVAAHLHPIQKK